MRTHLTIKFYVKLINTIEIKNYLTFGPSYDSIYKGFSYLEMQAILNLNEDHQYPALICMYICMFKQHLLKGKKKIKGNQHKIFIATNPRIIFHSFTFHCIFQIFLLHKHKHTVCLPGFAEVSLGN